MNLCFLTEEQQKYISGKPYKYTKRDVNDLAVLSSSIESLTHVMGDFLLCHDGGEDDQTHEVSIFNILELLIKPITCFLNDGASVHETENKSA